MEIWVYAIAKNEAKFCRRWLESMSEADGIAVLDTGSTDRTREEIAAWAKEKGWELASAAPVQKGKKTLVMAEKSICPWRFDRARNESLKLVPEWAEILVCMDLDEIIIPGWRDEIEKSWEQGCTTGRYKYVWSFNGDGSDGISYGAEKIHTAGARWKYPVHEILEYPEEERSCWLNIRVEHHPDDRKSRGQYLELLELSVKENPTSDRNMHYLGREYMFRGRWAEAAETLVKHLRLPTATWKPERAASMMYIAQCCKARQMPDKAELWLLRAAMECPESREPWYELGVMMYEGGRWAECARYLSKCLDIKKPDLSYLVRPEAWGGRPWDIISIAWWHLDEYEYAINCAAQALTYSKDERIEENLKLYKKEQAKAIRGE